MRRTLVSPEIGALIGTVLVWSFFWGVGKTFGEADTTLNWLDVAAPYGIMATAVALLMIGGEFDLSAGVMTGATAIHIGLFSQHFLGEGVHIGWAIGGCFLAAAAVGWFNGFMVNRTGLPSFIITLASFFVLRGVILVMAKRLGGKVQVNEITKAEGAQTFKDWIAHEWKFTEFGIRDELFLGLVIAGGLLFAYGLLEQSFNRRADLSGSGVGITAIGLAAAGGGFYSLHTTDGVWNNVVFSAVTLVGVVLTIVGLGLARWVRRPTTEKDRSATVDAGVRSRFALGVAGVAVACLVGIPFDRRERLPILTWISSGLRPVIAIAAALLGIGLAARAFLPTLKAGLKPGKAIGMLLFALYAGLVVMTMVISVLQLATVQALRATLMLLLGGGGLALMLIARGRAAATSRRLQLVIGVATSVALVILAIVVRADSRAIRFRAGLLGALLIFAALLLANTLLEFLMQKRTKGDVAADNTGRLLQVVGFVAAFSGLIIRLVWSNLTAENAAIVKAAGGNVGQNVLRQTVVWWMIVAAIGAIVLTKSKWGNWIFAVGGNRDAARAVGVPADQVKIGLFVAVSVCGALSGTLIALRYGTVQANVGTGAEFEYIIAAVVGGCLMTGGYGSVIGSALGASILAISAIGMQTVPEWNSDGRYAFLGGVLLAAVLVNNFTRKKAQEAR
jgi:ribose/xylose/arabinose/galactoside ABC-type transport system permease subunit